MSLPYGSKITYRGHAGVSKGNGSSPEHWVSFTCGYCDTKVNGAVVATKDAHPSKVWWVECPECGYGSVFYAKDGRIYPGQRFGPSLEGLPSEVAAAYNEARDCMSVNAYTGAELLCRKILMYVAVNKSAAKEGDTFAKCLDALETAGYVTPPMRGWVDLIRQHGNASTHELARPDIGRAEYTVQFTALLLRIIYETEHMVNQLGVSGDGTSDERSKGAPDIGTVRGVSGVINRVEGV